MKNLYVGAAGVIWALDALRRRGHAETSLDLTAAALRTLDLERAERDLARRESSPDDSTNGFSQSFCSRSTSIGARSRTAGPWMTVPSPVKREPWQGQSHVFSARFQLR